MRGLAITMEYAGKILMLVENSLPFDQRVYREAITLQKSGYKVSVISLKRKGQQSREIINGVTIYRIPSLEVFGKKTLKNLDLFNRIIGHVKSFI